LEISRKEAISSPKKELSISVSHIKERVLEDSTVITIKIIRLLRGKRAIMEIVIKEAQICHGLERNESSRR